MKEKIIELSQISEERMDPISSISSSVPYYRGVDAYWYASMHVCALRNVFAES